MKLPTIKFGDIFEINTKIGFAYFQCVEESISTESELIRILPGTYLNELDIDFNELIQKQEVYFIQFPLKYAMKKKIVRKIGNYIVPKTVVVPTSCRSKHLVRGEFLGWHIVDRKTLRMQLIKELSEEQLKLSPCGMWNDTLIIERIENGWTLDNWR